MQDFVILSKEFMKAAISNLLPFALQAIMGHSDLETTKHYIALVEADIREAQEKASPVKKLVGENKRVR